MTNNSRNGGPRTAAVDYLHEHCVTVIPCESSKKPVTGTERKIFANYEEVEHREKIVRQGLSLPEIVKVLAEYLPGWPKSVNRTLFVARPDHSPRYLGTTTELFAYFDSQLYVDWATGPTMISMERFFAHLQESAESYDALEMVPHWPPLPRSYYMHPPLPMSEGQHLEEFVDFFSPLTAEDRLLMQSFVMCLLWGGTPGARPAWLVTGPPNDPEQGCGVGKSKFLELCGELVGGMIEISPTEDITAIKKRLLSPDACTLRLARIDNIKTYRFSWADLEGLITAPVISGSRLYRGEGRRLNTLTLALTLNGASLSKDLAQRVYVIKLRRPDYTPNWESQVRDYVQNYRWHIIDDARQILDPRSPDELTE